MSGIVSWWIWLFSWFGSRAPPHDPAYVMLSQHPGDGLARTDYSRGIFIVGATGGGKTQSVMATLVKAALRNKIPCLFTTAKNSDGDLQERWCRETNSPFVRFRPGGPVKLSLLDYLTSFFALQEVSSTLDGVLEMVIRTGSYGSAQGGDAFFPMMASMYCKQLIALLKSAKRRVTPLAMKQLLMGLPKKPEDALSDAFKKSDAADVLRAALVDASFEAEQAVMWALHERPHLAEKTRSGVEANIHILLDRLLASPIRETFCSDESNVTPEHLTQGRYSVILDFPALSLGAPAIFAQTLALSVFAKVALRGCKGMLMVLDESHLFLTQEAIRWTATGRSQGLWMIAATQGVATMEAGLGGGEQGRQFASAIMSNLQTHLYGVNNCPVTNERAVSLVGKERKQFRSSGFNTQQQGLFDDKPGGGSSFNVGTSEQMDWILDPVIFATLLPGEVVVLQSGRRWSNGKTYLRTRFKMGG